MREKKKKKQVHRGLCWEKERKGSEFGHAQKLGEKPFQYSMPFCRGGRERSEKKKSRIGLAETQ